MLHVKHLNAIPYLSLKCTTMLSEAQDQRTIVSLDLRSSVLFGQLAIKEEEAVIVQYVDIC